jgi:L-lactate dehydrogenase complex protein LldG
MLSAIDLALGFPPKNESLLESPDASTDLKWLNSEEGSNDLANELEALSVRFHRAETLEAAQDVVCDIIKEHSVKQAAVWKAALLDSLGINELLGEEDVEVCSDSEEGRFVDRIAYAELGITSADAVFTVSGTLVLKAASGQERATSLLPPIHLAVTTTDQMLHSVRDLAPLMRRWLTEEGHLPSAVNLISGASRTADIELNLVLGAHGPKVLHILQVDPTCIPTK